ncbi:MAG: lmo0937 family membrane protein [Acidobacteria bacterium]|nr:lmo0937 family membrane protein [Acidobacteriota bacterium]
MLWTILAVVLVLWLLGFVGGVGGSLIHALLLVAGVIFVLQILSGRRSSI